MVRHLHHFIEKRFRLNVRSVLVLNLAISLILLGAVLVLGWMSTTKVRDVVTEGFNQQQLVLARHAARQIENSLNMLKSELSLASLSTSIQLLEMESMAKRLEITFSSTKDEGVLNIIFAEDSNRKTHSFNEKGYQNNYYSEDLELIMWWAREEGNNKSIFISDISSQVFESNSRRLILKMATPVWQTSVDEKQTTATNRFVGIIMFAVDVTRLIEKLTKDIHSGKTGYAWVIDKYGTFLYHPEKSFVGKNALTARQERRPSISFERINEIQRENMMNGQEGTSWFVSGWHKGIEAEMKKLIAYTPCYLEENNKGKFWSVAVVAPTSEVEGPIHAIYSRQFILEGVVILSILAGGLLITGIMLRWSSLLKKEVDEKTFELKKSENQYRSLIEHANDIIFTLDQTGSITSINQAGLSFFNMTKGEIIGSNIREICNNENSAYMQYWAINESFTKKISRQLTYPVQINGIEYWLSTNFSSLLDESGTVYAILGIARDITERVKIQEQMCHTEKQASMGTLAAGVAHEINNPLAVILGFTDLLLERFESDPEVQDLLKSIENQGNKAKKVVENLLTFARDKEHIKEDVDINKNINAILQVVENTLSVNKIVLKKEMPDSLPAVKGDPDELQQVFLNIITNAVHAMKGGGILTISTSASDNGTRAKIMISDTGCGIKSEYRNKIFDPLFTTKKVGEGTGLGLFVSYGILLKLGGTINFETKTKEESEETGTTFIITL